MADGLAGGGVEEVQAAGVDGEPERLPGAGGVLEAWYPGQTFGTAIAAVLFGDANPAGRLPVTFPASDTQGPAPVTQPQHYPGVNGVASYDEGLDVGYRWHDAAGQQPLFPFGYGLSHESFAVSGVHASCNPARAGSSCSACVPATSRTATSTEPDHAASFKAGQ